MTEAEWLACVDPRGMLKFPRGKASDRKYRLFQAACCRRAWDHLPDEACREAVLVAERFADGRAKDRERRASQEQVALAAGTDGPLAINARHAAIRVTEATSWRKLHCAGVADVFGCAANPTDGRGATGAFRAALRAERRAEADLVRCIFGNPFRPAPTLHPTWLQWNGGTVRALAQSAYDGRELPSGHLDAVRLALLADALEDSGCSDAAILEHLRAPGPHVRGCWVVDLVLGKS